MNKLRHNYQAYSKIHYDKKIKLYIKAAWKDSESALEHGELEEMPQHITIIQRVMTEQFALEDDSVKDEAAQYHAHWNKAVDEGKDPEKEEEWFNHGEEVKDDEEEEGEDEWAERLHIESLQSYREWDMFSYYWWTIHLP